MDKAVLDFLEHFVSEDKSLKESINDTNMSISPISKHKLKFYPSSLKRRTIEEIVKN